MSKYILGISYGYHDSTVALVSEGKIEIILAEERLSRVKHDNRIPVESLKYIKDNYGMENIELVVYYEDPLLKLGRIINQGKPDEIKRHLIEREMKGRPVNPLKELRDYLDIEKKKVIFCSHHDAHLYAALSMVEEKNYLGITIDGVGEFETHTEKMLRSGDEIKEVKSLFPNSLGLFYSAITSFLGFEVNDAEFKVMGLAAYGEPKYCDEMRKMISYENSDGIKLENKYFNFDISAKYPYTQDFIKCLGKPSMNSKEYAEEFTDREQLEKTTDAKRFADIAASAQTILTEIVNKIFNKYKLESIQMLYGGGVALNTKTNSDLMSKGLDLYILPDPGDGGSALGAANYGLNILGKKHAKLITPFLGLECEPKNVKSIHKNHRIIEDPDELIREIVKLLVEGKVVANCQGRAEFGPRALGNRSILCDPRKKEAQVHVNKAVKFREPFRPFAPAVLEENIEEFFEVKSKALYTNHPFYYMLATVKCKDFANTRIPACIHVDGTSRVQVVNNDINPFFYKLIKEFNRTTGVPALLNTSFNLRGEPMVNNEKDAIKTFLRSGIDNLIINEYIFDK